MRNPRRLLVTAIYVALLTVAVWAVWLAVVEVPESQTASRDWRRR